MKRDTTNKLTKAKPHRVSLLPDSKEYKTVITFNEADSAYNIYLTSEITGPDDYVNVYDTFLNAQEGDTIRILLSTPGGRLDTTNKIIGLGQITQARTVAIANDVASAGTILSLAFDDLVILPHSEFMIHAASSGSWGKYHEVLAGVKFWEKEMPKYFHNYYKDFLTPEEIDSIIAGNDIYLNADEVEERWENVLKARDKELAEGAKLDFESTLEDYKQVLQDNGYTISKPKTVLVGTPTKQPKHKKKVEDTDNKENTFY